MASPHNLGSDPWPALYSTSCHYLLLLVALFLQTSTAPSQVSNEPASLDFSPSTPIPSSLPVSSWSWQQTIVFKQYFWEWTWMTWLWDTLWEPSDLANLFWSLDHHVVWLVVCSGSEQPKWTMLPMLCNAINAFLYSITFLVTCKIFTFMTQKISPESMLCLCSQLWRVKRTTLWTISWNLTWGKSKLFPNLLSLGFIFFFLISRKSFYCYYSAKVQFPTVFNYLK